MSYSRLGRVEYWRETNGICAKFWTDYGYIISRFRTLTEFKRAARSQFRRKIAHQTTAKDEAFNTLVWGN